MQSKYIPFVRDRHVNLQQTKDGRFYVRTMSTTWWAMPPLSGRAQKGKRVIVRFDLPGSDLVSVWRGETLLGTFTRNPVN